MTALSKDKATGLALLGAAGYYTYKRYVDNCQVRLITGSDNDSNNPNALRKLFDSQCPSLTDPRKAHMIPTPYLATGLLQTAYSTLSIRRRDSMSDIEYERELLTMSDGGTVSLDWYPNRTPEPHTPIVVVMSGVGGSSREYFIRRTTSALASHGYTVAVMNHRGCAGTPITSWRPYDSGFTSDFRHCIEYIGAHNEGAALVGLGFSMGANLLTKYVGEEGGKCRLACAVAICCPFDIVVSARAMNESNLLNDYVFQPAVVGTLKRALQRGKHIKIDERIGVDVEDVSKFERTKEIEEGFLVKVNECASLSEYYEMASSCRFVDRIDVPYLAINSLDDRITPPEGIPVDKFRKNENLALALVEHGGHLGFFEGLRPDIWYVRPVVEFVNAIVNRHKK